MKIVVDTNIIFTALLRGNNRFLEHLLLSSNEFYSMRFVMVELFKHKERIVRSSHLTEEEMLDFLHRILTNIRFVNEEIISIGSYVEAYRFCSETDIKDLPFLALAIELEAPLWTSDKALVQGVSAKGFSNFYSI